MIADFPQQVPMNREGLAGSAFVADASFNYGWFRSIDLLALPTGPLTHDLYVSHHTYRESGCIALEIHRLRLRAGDAGLVAEGELEPFFLAEPCLEPAKGGEPFYGLFSGGRMVDDGAGASCSRSATST